MIKHSLNGIVIRQSAVGDIPRLQEIFAIARRVMTETGNPHQWAADYPGEELLRKDIESGDSYVCLLGDRIVATFVLRGGNDPTYEVIYDGAWPDDLPYATMHRIASSGEVRGIMHTAMQFALQHYHTIRIDTHRDNRVMLNAIGKEGFTYCGIIHCWNGSEREAYQYTTITDKKTDTTMDVKEKVLATMKEAGTPLNAGKIAELSGLDRKDVDNAMKRLKAEGAIVSPVRCKWVPAE